METGVYYPDLGIGVHEQGYRPLHVEFVDEGKEKRVEGGWIIGRVEPTGVIFMSDKGGFIYTRGGDET